MFALFTAQPPANDPAAAAAAAAAAHASLGGYISLSLFELSLFKPTSILRIFAEKRHVALVHKLSSPTRSSSRRPQHLQQQQQQQQQQGVRTLWEVAAGCLRISEGKKSSLVWRCIFAFCLAHFDWRGTALCVSEMPIHPSIACDPWGRLKLADAAAARSSSSSSSSRNKRKPLLLLNRILSFLQRRRERGDSVFLDELLLQQLARRGLFLEAVGAAATAAADTAAAAAVDTTGAAATAAARTEPDDTALALLLQRLAKAGCLFKRHQQQQKQQKQQQVCVATDEMLPVGCLSPLHLFVVRLCLSNCLPSLFISYLEVRTPA